MAKTRTAIQPSALQILEHEPVEDERRRHAEIDEIRQRVELGAEARGALEKPRDAPVDAVEDRGRRRSR